MLGRHERGVNNKLATVPKNRVVLYSTAGQGSRGTQECGIDRGVRKNAGALPEAAREREMARICAELALKIEPRIRELGRRTVLKYL